MVKPIRDKSPNTKSTKCLAVAQKFALQNPNCPSILYNTSTRYGICWYNTNPQPNFR